MNVKIYNLIAALLFSVAIGNAQNFEWGGRFGGNGEDVVRAMHVDEEGNVYTTGYFTDQADFNIGEDVHEISAVGFFDVFIQKTDADGNFVWAKAIGSDVFDYGTGISTDATGSVFVTGVYSGETDFNPGPGEMIMDTNGGEDIFVLKLTSAGEFSWVKTFGSSAYDEPTSVQLDGEGNVFVSGYFNETADFDPSDEGEYLLTSQGGNDNFVVKLSASGEFEWAVSYGNEGFEAALSMYLSENGHPYITGFFEGTVDFNPGEGVYELTSEDEFSRGIFMLELDSDGSFMQAVAVSGPGNMLSYDVELDSESNIYLAGTFANTIDFDPGPGTAELTSGGFDNAFILKLNSNAEFIWVKQFESTESITNYEISLDDAGNVYACGFHETAADFNPDLEEEFILNEGDANAVGAFVAILDSNGDFVNALGFGGVNFLDYHGIGVDGDGTIYTSAAFENTVDLNPDEDDIEEVSAEDFRDNYIVKFSPIASGIEDLNNQELNITAYPNPLNDEVTLQVNKELIGSEFSLIDLSGKIIARGDINALETTLTLNHVKAGIYILKVNGGTSFQLIKQ